MPLASESSRRVLQNVVLFGMSLRCEECTRLWDRYYLAVTEAFRAEELLAAAKREKGDPNSIVELSAHQSASYDASVASEQMKSHRDPHARSLTHAESGTVVNLPRFNN
jgi:hypothetical protein